MTSQEQTQWERPTEQSGTRRQVASGYRGMPHLVAPPKVRTPKARRSSPTQLIVPGGKPDLDALRAVIDDWLVPMLVKEFLDEYSARTGSQEKCKFPRTTMKENANAQE